MSPNWRPGDCRAGQWSMAGRLRTAIASLERARAACHPSRPEWSGGGAKRLDTPPAEASHARSRERWFDTGYSDRVDGAGRAGSLLISAFSSLPGLK